MKTKKSGGLLTNFRDLTRGFRLDEKTSVAAVRQIFKNKSSIKRTVSITPPAHNAPPSAKAGPDEDKKTGELLTSFRDLARGFRLDTKSEAAVRQMVVNISSLDEKVKPETDERPLKITD